MDKQELTSQPWMVFPATCTHGCGTYYSMAQIIASPCISPMHHHDFTYPPRSA